MQIEGWKSTWSERSGSPVCCYLRGAKVHFLSRVRRSKPSFLRNLLGQSAKQGQNVRENKGERKPLYLIFNTFALSFVSRCSKIILSTYFKIIPMLNEQKDFINALERFIQNELKASGEPADYNNHAIEIIDARNHLFRNVGIHGTDEACGIFAIRSLCHIDEDSMEMVPDRQRLAALAREFGLTSD